MAIWQAESLPIDYMLGQILQLENVNTAHIYAKVILRNLRSFSKEHGDIVSLGIPHTTTAHMKTHEEFLERTNDTENTKKK